MSRAFTSATKPSNLLFIPLLLVVSACSVFSDDPSHRTPGVIIDDNVLEALVEQEIRKSDQGYKGSHISVVSYNGLVLLTGQVPSEGLREKASTEAGKLRRVRKVHNELSVGGPTSMVARTNDGWLTSKVKTRLLASKSVEAGKIKVQTEDGVVFERHHSTFSYTPSRLLSGYGRRANRNARCVNNSTG